MILHSSLSLRERVRVRGKSLIYWYCPLIRPSATFSLREKGFSAGEWRQSENPVICFSRFF
jgi:hypothetical protein